MPTSVRLDPETERMLDRLVAAGQSRSQVIREAIRRLVPTKSRRPGVASFAARVADSIGILTNGDPDLSTDTGARLVTLLRARRGLQVPAKRRSTGAPRAGRRPPSEARRDPR